MGKRVLSAVIIAASVSPGGFPGCAMMSRSDCGERATCTGSDVPDGPTAGDSADERSVREGDSGVVAEGIASNGADGDAGEVAVTAREAGTVDADAGPALDVSTEPIPDDATADVESEEASGHDAGADADAVDGAGAVDDAPAVDSAASGASGEGSTCAASSCTNACVPYFVPCCKATGGCGCSLLFPPGPCM
jgi:hypothetical protein